VNVEVSVPGRWCLLAGTTTWCGVVIGFTSLGIGVMVAVLLVVVAVGVRRLVVGIGVVFLVLGIVSGLAAAERLDTIGRAWVPDGRVELVVVIAEEASGSSYARAVGEPLAVDGAPWHGPRLAIVGLDPAVPVGAIVTIVGDIRQRVSRVRDEIVGGTMMVDETIGVRLPRNPIVQVGNAIRGRVTRVYDGSASGDGLVRGLLMGDTDLLTAGAEEDLRRAGLAHFIAVSGSNVAMFLIAWWFVTAPISVRPIPRAVGGMVGLAIFAVVTRWEPSVIRASVMAAVPLLGGLVGIPFDPWMALGTAVTVLLLASGHLAFSVGFQLSVAATAGVLIGVASAKGRKPAWLFLPLMATMGAQVFVAPVILVVFGSVPLAAPLANLIVGPIVAITTAGGAIALVLTFLAPLVNVGADVILWVAGTAAGGPQLGWAGTSLSVLVAGAAAWRPTRPIGIAAVAIAALVIVNAQAMWPTEPTLVVLDVGQGDAILLQDPSGRTVLVDGGPDPRTLDRALRRNGVSRLDLVVVTHGDLDHVGGVIEILASGRVSELWVPKFADESGLLGDAISAAESAGIPIVRVSRGRDRLIGSFEIEVLGPIRRYQAENDGSVSLLVSAGRTVFLGGDIEAVAQNDVPSIRPDVLVVPHHGSRTTDLDWLRDTVDSLAVLSYGENRYGHPHPDVVAVLTDAGATVRHTYLEGDITVGLGSAP
jgi:competence protein ComEC